MPLRTGARRSPWAGGTSSLKPAYDGASIGTLTERTLLIDDWQPPAALARRRNQGR
ncbi:hypothetical protein ABZT51_39620 [Streptomyces sp. NPDC005373]|uniref:hypothetical protein n=1 Tax=Streptomyces sp. NPDC005373 TaxID=3156879 RepID=UPI0033A7C5E3